MKALNLFLIVCCVFATLPTAHADTIGELEKAQEKLFQQVAPAVVYISIPEGIGSGFFVRPDIIVTNAHVVGTHTSVKVITHKGKRLQARVIARAPKRVDLALLQVDYKSRHALRFSTDSLSIGTWVASVGHGVDSPWSFTSGMVSNVFKKKRSRPVFQTQIPLNPGNSGGPIFDRKGSVIGVVTSGIQSSNNVNFAIHGAEVIRAFPNQLGQSCECIRVQAPPGVPILVDGEYVGVGPLLVVPVQSGKHEVTATISGRIEVRSLRYPKVQNVDFR